MTDVTSVNQGNFVSENQTDFIFAVAGEEYGFLGCCANHICFFWQFLLNVSGWACERRICPVRSFAAAWAVWLHLQSFINICVATGIAPNTGTPLPFVSYGLTSLVSLYIGMGLVLNVGLAEQCI